MQTLKQASMTALLGLMLGLSGRAWAACGNTWTGASGGTNVWEAEAEAGIESGDMTERSSGSASNGTYVATDDAQDNSIEDMSCTGSNRGCSSRTFVPTTTGNYKIEAKVRAEDNSHNSFFVYIIGTNDCPGDDIAKWNIETTSSSGYTWFYVTDDDGADNADTSGNARVWYLTAGTSYTIVFRNREGGTRLDMLRMYLDPADAGPTPTPTLSPTNTTGATSTPTHTAIPTLAAATGLCAEYYDTIDLSGPSGLSNTAVSYNWVTGRPAGIGALTADDSFSVRFQGEIHFPWAGTYYLTTGSDDGARLWLGSVTGAANYITDTAWVAQSYTEYSGAAIVVTAGARRAIRMEYYEESGNAEVQLKWRNNVEIPSNVVIPQSRLIPNSGPCAASTATSTPFVSNTPTRTPTPAPTVWMGLPVGKRLYGLEYIPFPVVSSGGSAFRDLSYPATTLANNDFGKNTARYRIELTGLPQDRLQVETRIGPFGVTCTTGYFDINNYSAATTLSLPQRPQNLSTSYAWVGTTVPVTERFDALGDPRFTPHQDMLSLPAGQPFADNYCWFCKNLGDSTEEDYDAEYLPFVTQADYHNYNGEPVLDVPKLFQLWREGIVISRSIYTSMTGWSSYYIGAGGEIGGDSANKLTGGVPMYNGPWNASGSSDKDEITGAVSMVRSSAWYSMPMLGELWPDSSYVTDWYNGTTLSGGTFGNLRNTQQGGSAYRDNKVNFTVTGVQEYHTERHRTSSMGCGTFMNGNAGSNTFNHAGVGFDADLLYDGSVTALDYNFTMPATFYVNRPFGLNEGGNTPTEWGLLPYSGRRLNLEFYTATTQSATATGFYDWDGTSARRSSSAVRGRWGNNVGWYVMNGLAPSTDSGINFVARFAILSCLRTFQEAGAPALNTDGVYNGRPVPSSGQPGFKNAINVSGTNVSFRIEPIPWVKITDPTVGQDLSGYSSVTVKWTQRYVRWDDQRYTENYPCVDDLVGPCTPVDPTSKGNPNIEWHSLTGTALVYNMKYSSDGGSNWKSCLTNTVAYPGVYMDGPDSVVGNAGHKYQSAWDVSTLLPGKKLVRVECYRANVSQHYAYHEISLTTNP